MPDARGGPSSGGKKRKRSAADVAAAERRRVMAEWDRTFALSTVSAADVLVKIKELMEASLVLGQQYTTNGEMQRAIKEMLIALDDYRKRHEEQKYQ